MSSPKPSWRSWTSPPTRPEPDDQDARCPCRHRASCRCRVEVGAARRPPWPPGNGPRRPGKALRSQCRAGREGHPMPDHRPLIEAPLDTALGTLALTALRDRSINVATGPEQTVTVEGAALTVNAQF